MPEAPWLGGWVELGPTAFLMGASDEDRFAAATERPRRRIRVGRFAIGAFPVTEEAWAFEGGGGLPKVGVSWDEVVAWLDQAAGRCGLPLRLPSEAEWEFSARAGEASAFPGGGGLAAEQANFLNDESKMRVGPGGRTPAGRYPANAFGLEDMLGNVAEWVADAWSADLTAVPEDGRALLGATSGRVVRSGGWDAMPRLLRLSARHALARTRRQDDLGFRIAFDLP